jgi:hypothetical protein
MTKRWDTARIALWGAALGLVYSLVSLWMNGRFARLDTERLVYLGGGLFGGAFGGAILFATVSGVRNLILRAK